MKIKYQIPERAVSDEQLKLLRPYLIGEHPSESGEWDMFCPLHDDHDRSAQMNVEKGVWFCHKCDVGGSVVSLIRKQSEWFPPARAAQNGHARRRAGHESASETITPAKVAGWHAALLANEPILEDFITGRGLWTPTLKRFEIGWDESRRCYTIPIKDFKGEYVNVRRYQPRPAKGRRKMWGPRGMQKPRLYPTDSLESETIIVCGGELDAAITCQYGFPAITRTASEQTWKTAWNKLFRGKIVYLCHDMDNTGQEANRKVGLALAGVAKEVYVIRLPYPLAEKGGKDLTDYWLDHDGDADEFRRLMEEARPFDPETAEAAPEEIGPSAVSVLDSFDARRVGKPSRMTVTIKGKREPGYSVPRKVEYRCTQDAGEKCNSCPLFQAEGEDDKIIPGGDPVVLEMMDATKQQLTGALRRYAGIPECPRLRMSVKEFQSVEILFARPSVEHTSGVLDDGAYKNLKVISVGRHDTQPNNTVQVVGALYPEPRSQLNSFLAWDIAQMETSLDRFELDDAMIKSLRRFQPRSGQRPLAKVREIADDLAAHVTRIYGRPQLHAAMDIVFHSALSFNLTGKLLRRGWLDILVVGDSRTGKSEVATRLADHYSSGEIVSCEAATIAGVIGGVQQFGAAKEWAVTWGAIPLNDRRLVVLDEIGGLPVEKIAEMSSVRSSGVAELTKIQQERTFARTRLICLGNPRNTWMSNYTYGVQAIRPLIGNNEDIARFDLAMSVSAGEVSSDEINRVHTGGSTAYPADVCAALVRWVWSRTPDQILWAEGAENAVLKAAGRLGGSYVEDPPLIQVANVREKVARIAVAIAGRTFSTDESFERIVVTRAHVRDAVSFINAVYGMRGFGYLERSRELIADRKEAERKARDIKGYLYNKPWLAKFLRSTGKFRRQDLEEIGSIDREEANAIISKLWESRMVIKDKGDVRLTPTLHNILREVNLR